MEKHFEVYLAGAMKGLSWDQAGDWRREMADLLPDYIHTLSPLRGKDVVELRKRFDGVIQNTYEDFYLSTATAINMRDMNDCRRSDLICANLSDMNNKSVGTIMEIAWGRAFNKPLVIILPDKDNPENPYNHPMLLHNAIVVENMEDAADAIRFILATDRLM